MSSALVHCLPLLADVLAQRYGVTVRIGGDEAFTDGRTIHVPSLPATGDPTFVGMLRGYLDHEAAHIRFTDFAALAQAAPTPLEHHLWNSFEDWRIEQAMARLYPGCAENFHWLIRHLFCTPITARRPSVLLVLDWLLLTVRSWSVGDLQPHQAQMQDLVDLHWPGLSARISPVLQEMRATCPDSLACLAYARRVIGLAWEKWRVIS